MKISARGICIIALSSFYSMLAVQHASAGIITPTGYSMLNGQSGTFLYHDDVCGASGAGNNLLPITCDEGDLTDGVIATDGWFNQPALYVGWWTIDPEITFTFAETVEITDVTIYFDDPADDRGGVNQPLSATIAGTNYGIPDKGSNGPDSHTISSLSILDDELTISLERAFNFTNPRFIMISEIAFEGNTQDPSGVPAPATLALLGLGLLGLARRRKA